LGTALRIRLASEGHQVVRLVRREPGAGTESRWDPDAGTMDERVLDDVETVINLCGVGIADRPLTPRRKELVHSTRVNPTRTLASALAHRLESTGVAPALIQSSASGFYPTDATGQPMTEATPAGDGWIAELVQDWEKAARPAADAGVRVVWTRTSPVVDSSGGMFPLMKRAWSLGAGAKLGDGTQHMPLVQLTDYLRFVLWAAENSEASGPYNLTLPEPTTNAEFTDELATQLRRPRVFKAPKAVLSAVLGDLADQLLGDVWLEPQRAVDQGFDFLAPDVQTAIRFSLRD
jgi:uncharacterized protein (TIGR01777 family)